MDSKKSGVKTSMETKTKIRRINGRAMAKKQLKATLIRDKNVAYMVDQMPEIINAVTDEIIINELIPDVVRHAERQADPFLDLIDKELNW